MRPYHPRHVHHHFLRNLHISTALLCVLVGAGVSCMSTFVLGAATANFRMAINPSTLSIDVVDTNFSPISTPVFELDEAYSLGSCQSKDGALGTATKQIYIRNPDSADNGWSATLSALSAQDVWQGDGHEMDFNDATDNGCTDGPDIDSAAGRMMVDFSDSLINLGMCTASCNTDHITLGSSEYFVEGVTDSITLLSASATSSDTGDWLLQGTKIIQTIPPNQSPSDNYILDLYLSIVSS